MKTQTQSSNKESGETTKSQVYAGGQDASNSKNKVSGTGIPTGDDSNPNKPAREKEPTVPNQQR